MQWRPKDPKKSLEFGTSPVREASVIRGIPGDQPPCDIYGRQMVVHNGPEKEW